MADSVETGLAVAATLGALKQAHDFIAAVSGHPGESLATILGTIVNRRLNNVEVVIGRSGLTLLNIGVAPSEIPLNILQPDPWKVPRSKKNPACKTFGRTS